VAGAALLGALTGFLKARTGAHEVILTIMFNYIMFNFFNFLLKDADLLGEEASTGNAKSDPAAATAVLPKILGDNYNLHWGIFLALGAVVAFWWLMERSTIGFRLRMVGENAEAARSAGVSVERVYILAMGLSAAFVGLAAANQSLGSTLGLFPSAHANIGFDAITVALLGGSNAPGILLAGLLFGAFKAGAPTMQVFGVSPEVLGIVQGAIVLFIAAPPLIRMLFRLPPPQTSSVLANMRQKLLKRGGAK
jgi:simple sugar transport system permease protein